MKKIAALRSQQAAQSQRKEVGLPRRYAPRKVDLINQTPTLQYVGLINQIPTLKYIP